MIGLFSRLANSTNHILVKSQFRPGAFSQYVPLTCKLSSMASVRPRRFAPLDSTKKREGDDRPILKGIVFDVDGTLCEESDLSLVLADDSRFAAKLHVRRDAVRAILARHEYG
jgi:hypothetical protein